MGPTFFKCFLFKDIISTNNAYFNLFYVRLERLEHEKYHDSLIRSKLSTTALAREVMQSPLSVYPSVSTLTFEPSDLDLDLLCMCMGHDRSCPGIEDKR